METLLRPAALEDKEAILALMVSVIQTAIEPQYQAETVQNVTSNLDTWVRHPEASVHLLAIRGNAVVGVVLIKDFWNLCSLFVQRSEQGTGIGRRLTLAAVQACKGRSPIGAVYLNAAPGAVAFYRRLGFSPRESKQKLPLGFLPMGITLAPGEA